MSERHASSATSSERTTEAIGRASVLLPLPLEGAYDYRVPDGIALEPGDFVSVPLGSREIIGVVWDRPPSSEVEPKKLKLVAKRLEAPPLPRELRRFVEWVAQYTLTPPGAVLRMTMSVTEALEPARPGFGWAISAAGSAALAGGPPGELSPARRRVLAAATDALPLPAKELARLAGCGVGVVQALERLGLVERVPIAKRLDPPTPDWRHQGVTLSPEQSEAANALAAAVKADAFSVTLLDGVTGSGKTEVYFQAIAAALERGRQALVLLPEIALGAQWLQRFERRFGVRPAEWHSDLTQAERRHTWRAVAEGRVPVLVGARSALFLPFPRLGLIVIDEEHDHSYKQEDGVIYHARDMGVVRGSLAKFPVVLVSATPSLETVVNAEQGRYRRLHLPDRHGAAVLPEVRAIDMRRQKLERQRFLSAPLAAALEQTLGAREQAMLFLNRRGYAPLTLCRHCGYRFQCSQCTAWLVEHRFHAQLQCHHCGHQEPLPEFCPACGEAGQFAACGPGVERLAEEVAARFPGARVAVVASDTLTGPRAVAELVASVESHTIDVLIGTQMMAKGHHFPLLTLVGVVDADLGLGGGDLRAAERTFQLLHQVAGRAGRAERPGLVLLQTYMPEHPVMRALIANDRDRFLASEADERRRHSWPPFGRLAALILSGPDDETVDFSARAFARAAPHMRGVEVLGPAPAPLAVLRGRHRRRFLVKAERSVNLQAVLRAWIDPVKVPSSVRVQVDVDPYSFL
ncbi:MAG TPA: primosomal protein N' [Stellaceae bacterium]|nr:primosomal protein N' [Stellaceae bacterium]